MVWLTPTVCCNVNDVVVKTASRFKSLDHCVIWCYISGRKTFIESLEYTPAEFDHDKLCQIITSVNMWGGMYYNNSLLFASIIHCTYTMKFASNLYFVSRLRSPPTAAVNLKVILWTARNVHFPDFRLQLHSLEKYSTQKSKHKPYKHACFACPVSRVVDTANSYRKCCQLIHILPGH